MTGIVRRLFLLITVLSLTTSCEEVPNVLGDLASKDSDAAYYADAIKKADARQWDAAIELITVKMSANYRTRVDVRETLAGAYAGKCGLDFVDVVDSLSTSNSSKLLIFFMSAMKNKIVNPAACDSAVTVMNSFGNAAARTADQNLFFTVLGMAKAGAYLRQRADQDNAGSGDGLADAGFDVCNTTTMPDANVIQATVGLGIVLNNISNVSSLISGQTLNDVNTFKTSCVAALNAVGAPVTDCDLSDPDFVEDYVGFFRSFLNEGATYGIGTCTTDTLFTSCPCDGM